MAWASLPGTSPRPGWRAIDLPSAGAIEVRAGKKSPEDAEAVLVGFSARSISLPRKLPDGQGFAVERVPGGPGEATLWLALTRMPSGHLAVFTDMACNVVGALDEAAAAGMDDASALRAFIGRVSSWQQFMRDGGGPLSPEREIGLVGELAVAEAIIAAGVSSREVLDAWRGPLDGIQDFVFGSGALEAKATLASMGFPARIGSLDQLDDSSRKPLFVAGVRLRQADAGRSLPRMATEMRQAMAGDEDGSGMLADLLLAAGYIDAHADRYTRRFELAGLRVVEVLGAFPRLTSGSVPPGVNKAMYEIDLDKAPGDDVGIEAALKRLGAI